MQAAREGEDLCTQGLLRITVPVVSVEGEAAPAVAGLQEPLVS